MSTDAAMEWVCVPRAPTAEMLKAVDDEAEDKFIARGRAVSAWNSMLAAAPPAPAADALDAARYRWLQRNLGPLSEEIPEQKIVLDLVPKYGGWMNPEAWSVAIDAIISAQAAAGEGKL